MRIPHTCPVCRGAGKVQRPPWVAGDQETWLSSSAGELFDCRACSGSGIVVWSEEEVSEVPDRSESRIIGILVSVLDAWRDFPQLRLGQLIENAVGTYGADVFNIEDDELVKRLVEFQVEHKGKS